MGQPIPITDYKNLHSLRTNVHQDRRLANSPLRTINGLDTETYNGNIFLIADSDSRFLDKITPESCLKFLFSRKYQGSWNFFYNITYDAEVILKLLGEELNSYKKTGSLRFHHGEYTLDYIPAKKLTIKKGHHSAVFFDIAQFYHASLVNAYTQNIGDLPEDYLLMKKERSEFSSRYYSRNKTKIRNYCIADCKYTKQLTEHWIKLFYNAFLFYPARWISSGYLAEKVLVNNNIDIPKFDSVPYSIQDMAYKSYFGGRFEILKRGFIGETYLYDINSAYPYALTKIPDITRGQWISSNKIQNDVKLGFFKIVANIPDTKYVTPFPFRANNNIIFPSGKFVTYCTLAELFACKNISYKILESFQFIPETKIYPFKEFIEKMYAKRLQLKQNYDPLQLPLKIILNSIYGKTGERVKGKIGNLFNAVLFATITGITRAQLYEFVCKNGLEKDVVSFATDSVCLTQNLGINSSKLGQFSLDTEADDAFFLQNGFYRLNGIWKQRGLGKLGAKDIEHLETFEQDGKLFYKFKVLRSGRLRSSILQNAISEIGKIKEVQREVNLNADRKRFWLDTIKSIDEKKMNESMPLSLNYFNKEMI